VLELPPPARRSLLLKPYRPGPDFPDGADVAALKRRTPIHKTNMKRIYMANSLVIARRTIIGSNRECANFHIGAL
jgi:hypothetical protein